MIVKENITVYICQHCKKRYFKKHAAELHEPMCYSNPENVRACSHCVNLEETTNTYYWDTWNGEASRTVKAFKCKILEKMMYPFKAEKKGLIDKYPESFEEQIPMPKTCEHFKHEWDEGIFK